MSDNHWQRELAQVNRDRQEEERRRLDERWDRLSHGELSPEEDAELRALAETSEEAHAAYEAFRPLGPEFHARIVQKILPKPPFWKRLAALLPFPLPFRQWRFAGWSAASALATAAIVVMRLWPPLPPLPEYSMDDITKNVSAMRGEESLGVPVLAPGDGFTVIVRPATGVSSGSELEARCFLARGRDRQSLKVQPEIYPNGLVTIKASLGSDIPPGTWTLWAVVGRPDKLPDPAALLDLHPGTRVRQRDWVAVPKNVRIQSRDQPP